MKKLKCFRSKIARRDTPGCCSLISQVFLIIFPGFFSESENQKQTLPDCSFSRTFERNVYIFTVNIGRFKES